jgi:hypothetical protein
VEPKKDATNNDNTTIGDKDNNKPEEKPNGVVEISNGTSAGTNDSKEEKKEAAVVEKVIINQKFNILMNDRTYFNYFNTERR